MAGGEGREGPEGGWGGAASDPLHCKHDLFEWRAVSRDILVWADLAKQPRHCARPPETNL